MIKILKSFLQKIGLLVVAQRINKKRIDITRAIIFRMKGGSNEYWEKRYAVGGNSGGGSYNQLAEFKAETINSFLERHMDIETCIEWGCGDGNQLSLISYPDYVGIDVSRTIIEKNKEKYEADSSKRFYVDTDFLKKEYKNKADMSLSLDVIFHLVEDKVFDNYMKNLFDSSKRYVCIYSNNYESEYEGGHVKNRKFTSWISENRPEWELIEFVKQKYPCNPNYTDINTSACDFYFYELKPSR